MLTRYKEKETRATFRLNGFRSALAERIFLDRYAQKAVNKEDVAKGDVVVFTVPSDGQRSRREIGIVQSVDKKTRTAVIKYRDDLTKEDINISIDHLDVPMEQKYDDMCDRVSRAVAGVDLMYGANKEETSELAEQFHSILTSREFVPGGRILAGAGAPGDLTFFNCLPPEQEILTECGYRPIAEVQIGDRVVTHNKRLKKVLNRFERDASESMYTIVAKKVGFDSVRVTGDHKILTINSDWVNSHKSRDGLKLKEEPQWVPAKNLKVGDFMAVSFDKTVTPVEELHLCEFLNGYLVEDGKLTKSNLNHKINAVVKLDNDLCEIFGRWLGDGCVSHRSRTDIPSGIKIVFNLQEKDAAYDMAAKIERIFGVPVFVNMSSTGRWYDLCANSMPLGQAFKALFGCYSYGKSIPSFLMRLDESLSKSLIKGLFLADGYVSDNKMGILLANKTLSTQLHQLLLRSGYLFSIQENTHRNGKHPSYRLSATANECSDLAREIFDVTLPQSSINQKYYIEYNGLAWVRINSIEEEFYEGPVIDIEVDEDHSFITAGLVVSNCYVLPSPKDSRAGILKTAQEQFEIMSRGGGVGINVSSLRPKYDYVEGVNGRSSGAVSWADLYSIITGKVEQGGSRRGALMIILDDWHPDILDFIQSKHEIGNLDNANISIGISDEFMRAVEDDADWNLVFPNRDDPAYDIDWEGDLKDWYSKGRSTNVYKTVKARDMWRSICESAWRSAEPGLFFVDRYNKMSNSNYYSTIRCTNPCGEQGLPNYGVCNLGAINLGSFIKGNDFWPADVDEENYSISDFDKFINERIDIDRLSEVTGTAVHFLDNVIDLTPYFIDENEKQQKSERRVGLGVMGLAELFIRAGITYGSKLSVDVTEHLFATLRDCAYAKSSLLAPVKGSYKQFDARGHLSSGFCQSLPPYIKNSIIENGIRNVTLLTVAPTGTTGSMTATSTGIEPYFMFEFDQIGHMGRNRVCEPIVEEYYNYTGEETLPAHFVVTENLTPDDHVVVMATAQKYVDSSISKTCNLPNEFTVDDVADFYKKLYDLGCKGGTVYRDGSRQEQCLVKVSDEEEIEEETKAVEAEGPEVRQLFSRPRFGMTHHAKTHLGTVHVTLNLDMNNFDLFDVFIRLSKSGSDIDADTDAIGRLISLILRLNSGISTRRRLELIIDQLSGIASSQSYGFGRNRVRSVPDGIALCLRSMLEKLNTMENFLSFMQDTPAEPVININGNGTHENRNGSSEKSGKFMHMCPECKCASAVKADGCFKCVSCGYSEC